MGKEDLVGYRHTCFIRKHSHLGRMEYFSINASVQKPTNSAFMDLLLMDVAVHTWLFYHFL